MITPSKKLILPVAAAAIIGAGALTVATTSAASSPSSNLVQKIADTFHLDPAKVQAVFGQNRADRQAQAETNYEDRLSKAVTEGKLTAGQKSKVLAEHIQLKAELEGATQKTGTDRRSALQQIRTEAEAWAKSNGIDVKWLFGTRPWHGMGPHLRGSSAPTLSTSPSPSPNAGSQAD